MTEKNIPGQEVDTTLAVKATGNVAEEVVQELLLEDPETATAQLEEEDKD